MLLPSAKPINDIEIETSRSVNADQERLAGSSL